MNVDQVKLLNVLVNCGVGGRRAIARRGYNVQGVRAKRERVGIRAHHHRIVISAGGQTVPAKRDVAVAAGRGIKRGRSREARRARTRHRHVQPAVVELRRRRAVIEFDVVVAVRGRKCEGMPHLSTREARAVIGRAAVVARKGLRYPRRQTDRRHRRAVVVHRRAIVGPARTRLPQRQCTAQRGALFRRLIPAQERRVIVTARPLAGVRRTRHSHAAEDTARRRAIRRRQLRAGVPDAAGAGHWNGREGQREVGAARRQGQRRGERRVIIIVAGLICLRRVPERGRAGGSVAAEVFPHDLEVVRIPDEIVDVDNLPADGRIDDRARPIYLGGTRGVPCRRGRGGGGLLQPDLHVRRVTRTRGADVDRQLGYHHRRAGRSDLRPQDDVDGARVVVVTLVGDVSDRACARPDDHITGAIGASVQLLLPSDLR